MNHIPTKKNILLVMPYGKVGGMERLALNFYRHYSNMGYNVKAVKLVGLDTDIVNFGNDEIILAAKDFWQCKIFERAVQYASMPFKLKRIIKRHKVDYTISFGDLANCVSGLTRTKESKIASIHALKSIELSRRSLWDSLFKFAYKTIYRRFKRVICISKAIKEDLIVNFRYRFDNLEVIYNPHDIDYIKAQSAASLSLAEQNLVNNKVVLFLGRLCIQKSPWHLIKAFSLLQDKATKLVFIGDGDYDVEAYCLGLIESLGIKDRVIFLGRKANPYKYLKSAQVLALSSQYEGTPNVIAEAIVLGIPIVSSNCTNGIFEMMGTNEPVNDTGLFITEAGIITSDLFKGTLSIPSNSEITEDEILIARALNTVLSNRENFVGKLKHSRDLLLEKYKLDTVCKSYLGLSHTMESSLKS